MAVIAAIGIAGAIAWLLVAKKPIVNLKVFKDRNFAGACIMIGATGALLYASAVVIPQFAQTVINYDATSSGLILSPGGVVVIFLIPLVTRLMKYIQTRYVIATGFFTMGCAFLYSNGLVPNIDFKTLVTMRAFQSAALAFLFVPISTIAYTTLPRELNSDATALFSMFRNVFGSVGISLATAQITQSMQTRQFYLSQWATPFHQPYNDLVATYEAALISAGRAASAAHQIAVGRVYQVFLKQVQVLAYADVFLYCSVVAFAIVPICFLLSSKKGGRPAAGGH
jgi:DHA2 family multidrug resistance protein